jgi:hypothetical protein
MSFATDRVQQSLAGMVFNAPASRALFNAAARYLHRFYGVDVGNESRAAAPVFCLIGNVTRRMDARATGACGNAQGLGAGASFRRLPGHRLSSSSHVWGFVARVRSLRRGLLFSDHSREG